MNAAIQFSMRYVDRGGFGKAPRGSNSAKARAHRGTHSTISATSQKPIRRLQESQPQRMQQPQISKALDFWKKGQFEEAECIFGALPVCCFPSLPTTISSAENEI